MIRSFICCSSLKSILAKPTSFLWNNMNFLKCFRCVFAVCIDSSRCRNVDDTIYLVWLLISFIECEFSIIFLIMSWIAFMRLLDRMLLIEVAMWFSDKNVLICSRRRHRPINSWECSWYLDDLSIIYEKSISHECFRKMCKLFQLSWCFWPAVTTVSNRELETIDACRWRRQWDQMFEITYVDLSLYGDK